jgi:peptidoglycan-associated lipoprotein
MNKIKILSSILLLGLLAGCAQKEETVSFDDTSKKVQKDEKTVSDDDKLAKIKSTAGNESVVESGDDMTESTIKSGSGSYINQTTSVIDGNSVTLNSIHFGFDMFNLTEEMQTISIDNSSKIKDLSGANNNFKIKLEGNCDEWGTDEYNYALGLKRTKSVKKDLIRNGISSDRIVVVSYGESNPLCTEQTAKCWKKNRRVDYKLLP